MNVPFYPQLEPDNLIVVVYCALAGGLILTLLTMTVFKFVVQRPYGGVLLGGYVIVMITVAMIEFRVIHVNLL